MILPSRLRIVNRATGRVASALVACGLFIAGPVSTVHAQAAHPFFGTWRVTFNVGTQLGAEEERQAELVVNANGGSWQTFNVRNRKDPCTGREVPVAVDAVSADRLNATLRFSTLGEFCKDQKLVLEVGPDGKVQGRRGQTKLALERK